VRTASIIRDECSLMMEAVRTSETSVDNHFTRQYNPEDSSEHGTGNNLVPLRASIIFDSVKFAFAPLFLTFYFIIIPYFLC
jgi:hypothetical protein